MKYVERKKILNNRYIPGNEVDSWDTHTHTIPDNRRKNNGRKICHRCEMNVFFLCIFPLSSRYFMGLYVFPFVQSFCVCVPERLTSSASNSVILSFAISAIYGHIFRFSFPLLSPPLPNHLSLFFLFLLRRVSHLPKLAFQQIPSNPHHEYWLMSVHYNTSHLWKRARLCACIFSFSFFRGFHKVECNTRDQVGKSDL